MEKGIQLNLIVLGLALVLTVMSTPALAGFGTYSSSRNGSDGPLEPQSNFVVPVILNGVAHNDGVYYFTAVNIPANVTVTFEKNAANTPITIVANGDVIIAGMISVNGSDGSSAVVGAGGPGGFGGGGVEHRGEGPGGGGHGTTGSYSGYTMGGGGGGGGFATVGAGGKKIGGDFGYGGGSGGATYGNNWQLPQIIGGSGGGGGGLVGLGGAGGGGGGAIVIASSGIISVAGSITANGGSGAVGAYIVQQYYSGGGGGGSGGAIRLIAKSINCTTTTSIAATGGGGGSANQSGGTGGSGRITFEAPSITKPGGTNPTNPAYYPGGSTEVPPTNIPSLSISSIGTVSINTPPKGAFSTPDVMLPFDTQNPVSITVTGRNIPIGTTVTVTATPSVGAAAQNNIAHENLTQLGSDILATTATAAVNISFAYPSTITASVTFNLAAAGMGPIYAAGEKVESMRVATNLGGKSTMIYITASGREIPAVM